MTIDTNRLIAGIPVKYLSAALRRCGSHFTPVTLANALGAEFEPSAIDRLIGLHYMKRDLASERESFCLTDKGKLLSSIKGMSPMKRADADALLVDLFAKTARV